MIPFSGRKSAKFSGISSFPLERLRPISQMETELARISFSGLAMAAREVGFRREGSLIHQRRVWLSRRILMRGIGGVFRLLWWCFRWVPMAGLPLFLGVLCRFSSSPQFR